MNVRFALLLVLTLVHSNNALATNDVSGSVLVADQLRCEYLSNPVSIDITEPRLSWIVSSKERGQRQSAYRVLVASTPEKLSAGQGDLWDSERQDSDQTLHVAYAGRPLQSGQACYWKVRVWDRQGRPSPWSKTATWTMALLKPSDWEAEWIAADAKLVPPKPRAPHNGYHSQFASSADTPKWVMVDLGQVQQIDTVQLFPARPFNFKDTPGFLFPVRFKIEAAKYSDFSDAVTLVDRTEADVANPGTKPVTLELTAAAKARYVRLTATRLAQRDSGNFAMALAEMKVLHDSKNLAKEAKVSSHDSIEAAAWSKSRLVDGITRPDRGSPGARPQPATMLRKEFTLPKSIKQARVYVTGLGLYKLWMNGHPVGDQVLAPEWTRYPNRLQYQTYDVTKLLNTGDNVIGAMLSEGWYGGRLMARPAFTEPVFRLLLRLDVEYTDGTRKSIVSDGSWRGTTEGPIRESGIYNGEVYDARKEMPGWNKPNFDTTAWKPTRLVEANAGQLVAQPNEPIRITRELSPIAVTEPKPGVFIYDFGQNMVGWCRVQLNGPRGAKVTLRHGEVLNPDGTLYTANLRSAVQEVSYILRGDGEKTFEPSFTYHGFRYLEVTGSPEPLPAQAVTGCVFHSDSPEVSRFECSKPMFNQLMKNILWVQRGNLHSTPTDCPQRDERFGWMGDIQVFSQTAIFNMDMSAFFTKWVADIRDSQAQDGRYSDFSPNPLDPNRIFSGAPAWGDAGTIVPWRVYQNYADKRMLAQHFDSAKRWVDFIHRHNPNLLWQKNRGSDWNDWLNGDTMHLEGFPKKGSALPKEVFATSFFAHSTEIVAKMAKVLGREEESRKYGKLAEDIKKAYRDAYVKPDGKILGDTQAGYAMALHFRLVKESQRPAIMKHLLSAIRRFKDHPSTGIQTTHQMLLALSQEGQHDKAFALANLRTPPSWGYMIEMGATTIWERWDGNVQGRGIKSPGMNSFNHWALGAIGEWMWRELAGIHPDESQPGFKHFLVRPRPVGDLRWVKSRYDSIRGPIESNWKIEDGQFNLSVVVPANTTATVTIPTRDQGRVTESGKPTNAVKGIRRIKSTEPGTATFVVPSGSYDFSAPW